MTATRILAIGSKRPPRLPVASQLDNLPSPSDPPPAAPALPAPLHPPWRRLEYSGGAVPRPAFFKALAPAVALWRHRPIERFSARLGVDEKRRKPATMFRSFASQPTGCPNNTSNHVNFLGVALVCFIFRVHRLDNHFGRLGVRFMLNALGH